jgi:PAS domain S-box-containing protein
VDRRSDVDIESCLANLSRIGSGEPWYPCTSNEMMSSSCDGPAGAGPLGVARSAFPRRNSSDMLDLKDWTMSPSQLLRSDKVKRGALQDAIFNSRYFSSIATDERGVIQIFNVGAEWMLGYSALELVNKHTPAEISDPQGLIEHASALSLELDTEIAPGFEALAFKASRGIEDSYELTYIRKDGSRCPATVSVTALCDERDEIIGYLLIGTDTAARNQGAAMRPIVDPESTVGARSVADRNVIYLSPSQAAAPTVVRHALVGRRTRTSSRVHSELQYREAAL